jgi:hypothetical protein
MAPNAIPDKQATIEVVPQTPGAFVRAASACVREVQAAMTDLLDDAGLAGAKPTHIGRALKLDKTLAWKIARFIEDPDPDSAARHMPGSAGVEIVLKAAAKHGVTKPRVDAVRLADERLREFMRKHAGDRRSFEAMLAKGGRDDKIESEERKSLFKSGSAIWGVRAKAQMLMLALRPSSTDPERIDVLQLGGMFEFERLRADVPWIIRRLTNRTDQGSSSLEFAREPLDPNGSTGGGVPLVREFCAGEIPEIRQFESAEGVVYDELAPSVVGRHGAVTFVSGEIYRGAIPLARSEDNTEGRYKLTVRTPVESVMFDLLIHRDLAHFGAPVMRTFGLIEDRPSAGGASRERAALYDPEDAIGLGDPPRLQTPRLAGYAGMIDRAFEMGGWGDVSEFRAYRAEMSYPPIPCEVMLTSELREG